MYQVVSYELFVSVDCISVNVGQADERRKRCTYGGFVQCSVIW